MQPRSLSRHSDSGAGDATVWQRPVHPWYRSPRMWLEVFVLFNLAGLSPDIYLAHSMNLFARAEEYLPFAFSAAAPVALLVAVVMFQVAGFRRLWLVVGHLIGWISVAIGVLGLVLHLESRFFEEFTLASLVYAAPFAAPLAYTGLGLLLIMNRMVPDDSPQWPMWVLLLALGGFVGNFVFSVTDHAQNGFFNSVEWVPVFSSALAVGALAAIFVVRIGRTYLIFCAAVLLVQSAVGFVGFYLHLRGNLHAPGRTYFERMVYGAPVFAPMLFPDLALLSFIGLTILYRRLPATGATLSTVTS